MNNFGIESMAFVYCHTNKINGKKYVGQTCKKPEERWQHGTGYKGCTYFYSAIQKYGWNNFDHEILCIVPESVADTMEKYFIKYYNTNDSDFGYNLEDGGNKSKHLNKSTKQKLSKKHKELWKNSEYRHRECEAHKGLRLGHYVSPETRLKISKNHKGRQLSAKWKEHLSESHKGKALTLECKKHLSESLKGHRGVYRNKAEWLKHLVDARKDKKPVICLETGIIYDSIHDASRQLNINYSCIDACCRHVRCTYSADNLHFEFACDAYNDALNKKQRIEEIENNRRVKPVICLDTGIVFDSCHDAARSLNIYPSNVRACCIHKYKSTHGYHFDFYKSK